MAQCIRYVCQSCGNAIEAWSDGNPYYIDEGRQKQYAYHPDHERLARCTGNDSPHICLDCDKRLLVDSRDPTPHCPKCKSTDIADTYELDGRRCPSCKNGVFAVDPDFFCIS